MSPVLQDGHYKVSETWFKILLVQEDASVVRGSVLGDIPVSLKYGELGDAYPGICEATGQSIYTVELSITLDEQVHKELGVITENGKKMMTKSSMGLHEYEYVSEEEANELLEEDGDPIDAPAAPYKIQPDNQGSLLWFSGPPGLGKSTSAQLLAKEHEYVYYEADCFNSCKNPYISVDVDDPSMQQMKQRNLKGEGLEKRMEVIRRVMKEFGSFLSSGKWNSSNLRYEEYYALLCQDIARERERIGGDWAVAQCAFTRDMRDCIRRSLPDVVFVLLEMDEDATRDRLHKRHMGDENAIKSLMAFRDKFDPAGEGEGNVVTVKVTKDMTPQDVINQTLEKLNL